MVKTCKNECVGYTLAIISVPKTTALRQMPGIEAPDLGIDPSERILFDEIN